MDGRWRRRRRPKRGNIALKQRNYAGASQFKQKCNANRRLKGFEINRRFFPFFKHGTNKLCNIIALKAIYRQCQTTTNSTWQTHTHTHPRQSMQLRDGVQPITEECFSPFILRKKLNIEVIEEDILQNALCAWFDDSKYDDGAACSCIESYPNDVRTDGRDAFDAEISFDNNTSYLT